MTPPGLRRVRDRAELDRLHDLVAPLEPRSTMVAAALAAARAGRPGVQIRVADGPSGAAGVLASVRRCVGRWSCHPVVLDPSAAPALGRAVDAGRERELFGFATDVDALAPHVRRARHQTRMPGFAVPAPIGELPGLYEAEPPPGTTVRLAVEDDVGVLTRCYEGYELIDIPTVGQLRRYLRRELRAGNGVLVVERDGRLVAANRLMARSGSFAFWSDATVVPTVRGEGLMRHLIGGCVACCRTFDLGIIGTLAPSNPMPVAHARDAAVDLGGGTDEWVSLWLGWRLRFRGQGRLLHARDRLFGRPRRRRRLESRGGPVGDET